MTATAPASDASPGSTVGHDQEWEQQRAMGNSSQVIRPGKRRIPKPRPLGLRWPVERTNSWLSNFGQMRRNTDRRIAHRLTQMALAITLLITAKLIDWRNRWAV